MLTKQQLKGPWAGLPVAWKDDGTFDEATYRADVARCCAARVPGVYTGGTTGEFYAQEKGADAIQVALPFWMEVPDNSVVRFFKELSAAAPGLPITIYEVLRAKKAISLELHLALHEAIPAIIGVKSTSDTLGDSPEGCKVLSAFLQVFVAENRWHALGPSGAIGSCSSFVYQNPRIMRMVFDLLLKKRWDELKTWMDKYDHLIREGLKPMFEAGCADSAVDRLLGLSAGFLKTSLRCRGPYPSCTEKHLADFRLWLKNNYPEFLEL